MTGARLRALVLAMVALIGAAAIGVAVVGNEPTPPPPRPPSARPALLLLTSLPLVFSEGFNPNAGGSAALKALETRYRVIPISVTSPAELERGRLLLMAHPLAQPAEDLVALDDWVRRGGRLMLFADPMLEWPSERPLGDPLRPPPMFMDTGLLIHWGLRLDAPDERGMMRRKLGRLEVVTHSPGSLEGGCTVSDDRLVAHCRIGRGAATIVADADLLDAGRLGGTYNLDALLIELAALETQ